MIKAVAQPTELFGTPLGHDWTIVPTLSPIPDIWHSEPAHPLTLPNGPLSFAEMSPHASLDLASAVLLSAPTLLAGEPR